MTEQELVARTMQNFVEGDDDGVYGEMVVGVLLETIILAAIGAVVGWLVKRCLNANFDAEKLDRLVRWGCKVAARTKEAKQTGLDPEGIYEQHGERLAFAITKTRKGLKRRDLRALERANPQPIGFANTPEFPEEA